MSEAVSMPEDGVPEEVKSEDIVGQGGVFSPTGFSWAMLEFARIPFYLLVVIYLFVPTYFAKVVAGGGPQGQAVVASISMWAGLIGAATAPILGAMVDQGGRRKPLLAAFLLALAAGAFSLWFVRPDGQGIGVLGGSLILVFCYLLYTYSEVMHNAMLPLAGRASSLPSISGMGLALGNFAGVFLFIALLFLFLLPANANINWSFLPSEPLFGLNAESHEIIRMVGPLAAIWILLFAIPYFRYMPDGAKPGASWYTAARDLLGLNDPERAQGKQNPVMTVLDRVQVFFAYIQRLFKEYPEVMKFLFARMLYADGLAVVLKLGGVYAALFLGWSGIELSLYAIFASFFAVGGGLLAGVLDQSIGARRSLIIVIVGTMLSLGLQLSITPDSLFFGLIQVSGELWSVPIFNTWSDITYLLLIGCVAVCLVVSISSSRFMLIAMAPKERVGEFFGLYTIVGTVTVWIGPMLVLVFTNMFNSQRIGMAAANLLFVAGLFVLLRVRHDGRPAAD